MNNDQSEEIADPGYFAAASELTECGWPIPVASNVLRRLLLRNDVRTPGDIILTLTDYAGIRIRDTSLQSALSRL